MGLLDFIKTKKLVDAYKAETTNRKVFDLGGYVGDITTDMVDLITQKISEGFTKFLLFQGIQFNKTLLLQDIDGGILFEASNALNSISNVLTIKLNTGGVGIKIKGSNYITFNNVSLTTVGLPNPSTLAILQQRSTLHNYSQWHNFKNMFINMHSDLTANGGHGTIGIYNDTAELCNYDCLSCYADIPIVFTRDNLFGLADVHRSSSMKCVTFGGVTTLVASQGHAAIFEAVASFTFENFYFTKIPTNTENYGVLITGQVANGYENFNMQFINFDCEEFFSSFLITAILEQSLINGTHNKIATGYDIISVKENSHLSHVSIKIFLSGNPTNEIMDIVKFYDTTNSPACYMCDYHLTNSVSNRLTFVKQASAVVYSDDLANLAYPTTGGAYFFLTNICRLGVVFNGKSFNTNTHYFTKLALDAENNQFLDGPTLGISAFIAPKDGIVCGIQASYSTTLTQGNLDFAVMVNGVQKSFEVSALITTTVSKYSKSIITNIPINMGDTIEIVCFKNSFIATGGNLMFGLSVAY